MIEITYISTEAKEELIKVNFDALEIKDFQKFITGGLWIDPDSLRWTKDKGTADVWQTYRPVISLYFFMLYD